MTLPTPPSLVGREAPLGALVDLVTSAVRGRGGLAVVSGEAGIGKTALAQAVADDAVGRGAVVTWGRAWEHGEAPSYFPLRPCLRSLGIVPPEGNAAPDDEGAAAFSLWERVLEALAHASRGAPVVWIIEDAHAADLLSLDLLAYLAQPLRALACAVVVTTRARDPRLGERQLQRLGRITRGGLDVRIEPLEEAECAALAARVVGNALPGSAARRIAELTGGNPLFVVECARSLRASGGGPQAALALPSTVVQIVGERAAELAESTRRALAVGAIFGREFSAALVARVVDALPALIIDELAPALRAGLIVETRPGHFSFSHVLVRDAIESGLPAAERARLHGAAERALALAGDAPEILVERARHALEAQGAGDDAGAGAAAAELADRAARLLEAEGAFDRAFDLRERIDQARRAGLLPPSGSLDERLHAARIGDLAGRHGDVMRICEEVATRARAAGDFDALARAALIAGTALRPGVVDARLVAWLKEALAAVSVDDVALRSRLQGRLAAALQPAEDPAVPCAMAREAIAMARTTGDDAIVAEVLLTAGAALVDFAGLAERIALAEELHARATAANDGSKILRARARLVVDFAERGDFAASEAQLDRLLELAAELGHPRFRWRSLVLSSMRAISRGDLDVSERCLVEAEALAGLTDDPASAISLVAHRIQRSRLLHLDGEMRAYSPRMEAIVAGIPEAATVAAVLRSGLGTRLHDVEGVRRELTRIEPRVSWVLEDPSFRGIVGEAAALAGTDEQRRRVRKWLAEGDRPELVSGHVPMTHEGPTARIIALIDAALGDVAPAVEKLRELARLVGARGHRLWEAQLALDLGRVQRDAGDLGAARDALGEAERLAAAIGLDGLASRARAMRDAIEDRANDAPAAPPASSRAGAIAEPPPEPPPASLARPAPPVMRSEGDGWSITWSTRTTRVRDSRGMRLLARLVERPDEDVHVLALASDEGAAMAESDAGAAIDERALRAYRGRLAQIDAALEAESGSARLAALRREREMIEAELRRSLGLGGTARRAGSVTEKARVNVQRRLKDALARIAEADAELGRYLERAVRTGTYCCFRP